MKRADALKWVKDNPRVEFEIKFKKVDGSIRTMRALSGYDDGTLVKNPLKAHAPTPEGLVKVYDLDKKEYRSFKTDSLLSINIHNEFGWIDIEEARIVSASQTS